jgi:hypothetical protein
MTKVMVCWYSATEKKTMQGQLKFNASADLYMIALRPLVYSWCKHASNSIWSWKSVMVIYCKFASAFSAFQRSQLALEYLLQQVFEKCCLLNILRVPKIFLSGVVLIWKHIWKLILFQISVALVFLCFHNIGYDFCSNVHDLSSRIIMRGQMSFFCILRLMKARMGYLHVCLHSLYKW